MDMINLSARQKAIVWVTAIVIMLWLGLNAESKVIGSRFMVCRTSVLNLYGFPIGLSQDSYYFKIQGPTTSLQQGLPELIPIAKYKYRLATATFFIGLLFFMIITRLGNSILIKKNFWGQSGC
ncbi:MAG: hypothetical protein Q8R14_02415 [Candidatus Omnitrophota bacterium]|nr:hypothetical protein [Candidatus Omnitrophota bacterium]